MNDRAVHIAAGLRLGANICEPHQCPCEATVDDKGLHGLSCKGGSGWSVRQHALNDLSWWTLSKADILATKEPSGLLRTDGKQLDGVTLLPWKNGRCATWDVTVTDTMTVLPPQYISYGGCCSGSGGRQDKPAPYVWQQHVCRMSGFLLFSSFSVHLTGIISVWTVILFVTTYTVH